VIKNRKVFFLAALMSATLLSGAAQAGDPAKTYQVAVRAAGFVEGASGTSQIGIVFDPAVAESVAAKDAIMAQNGGSLKVGQLTVAATPVEASKLSGTTGLKGVYLTPGLSSQFGAVQAYANANKVLSMGADVACVKGGQCVVGAETEPSVQVYVNNAAAGAAGISFQSAFRMMIKEL